MAPENPLKCHLPGVCPAAACHSAGRKEEAETLPALSPSSLNGAWSCWPWPSGYSEGDWEDTSCPLQSGKVLSG